VRADSTGSPGSGEDGEPGPRREPPSRDTAERDREAPRHPSELEVRWRQARNPPPPVLRAVLANLAIAVVAGIALIVYDWLAARGGLPGGDQRAAAAALYVLVVIASGSLFTYLWVALPTGASGERRRSPWAALLGFFASIPIVYLALVVMFQVVRPAMG
jgi:hypothetical protein